MGRGGGRGGGRSKEREGRGESWEVGRCGDGKDDDEEEDRGDLSDEMRWSRLRRTRRGGGETEEGRYSREAGSGNSRG